MKYVRWISNFAGNATQKCISHYSGRIQRRREFQKNDNKKKCHFEGHLNAPIVDDEVEFVLKYDEFVCVRHKEIKNLLKTKFDPVISFREAPGCWWDFLEDIIKLDSKNIYDDIKDLSYLVATAIWNTQIHHEAYYGVDMNIQERLNNLRDIIRLDTIQDAYKDKKNAERTKTSLTGSEQLLGEFRQITKNIYVGKELTIIHKNAQYYLYPTTMFICVLDNFQTRFYIHLHVKIKETTELIPKLYEYYKRLHGFILCLRKKYKDDFFYFYERLGCVCNRTYSLR